MKKMKKLRVELGLTVREVAEKAGVAVGYISTLENDYENKTNPSKDVMVRISRVLNSTVADVFF